MIPPRAFVGFESGPFLRTMPHAIFWFCLFSASVPTVNAKRTRSPTWNGFEASLPRAHQRGFPAHWSSQSFGSAPSLAPRLRPRGLSRIWVTTHRVKISWSWSWGVGGFQWFLLQFSSNVTDRGQRVACQEMALITFDGTESAAAQKRERRCRGGRMESHWGLQ